MLGANFDADGTLIMTSCKCATNKRIASIMNSGDKTGFVARLEALGLLWKGVEQITLLDTKIDNETLALALQSQVSFINMEWDELKVNENIISGKCFFKPAL